VFLNGDPDPRYATAMVFFCEAVVPLRDFDCVPLICFVLCSFTVLISQLRCPFCGKNFFLRVYAWIASSALLLRAYLSLCLFL